MELLSLYELIGTIANMFGKVQPNDTQRYGEVLLTTAIVAGSVALAFFFLQGFALYCMAKRRGLRYRGLAFVPFVNVMLMSRLAGETTFFGRKVKRAGLYAMLAQIAVTVISASYILADVYLHYSGCIGYEEIGEALEQFRVRWDHGNGFQKFVYTYAYDVVGLLNMIFGLLCEILMLMLLCSLFKRYAPESYVWMTVLVLFVPLSSAIILFALRNRRAVDYQAYTRAKYDAYVRRQQQYYGQGGSPYGGSPYGGSPYGGPSYGGQQPRQERAEEPFSEFASDKKEEEPFSEFSSDKSGKNEKDSDGFFD